MRKISNCEVYVFYMKNRLFLHNSFVFCISDKPTPPEADLKGGQTVLIAPVFRYVFVKHGRLSAVNNNFYFLQHPSYTE